MRRRKKSQTRTRKFSRRLQKKLVILYLFVLLAFVGLSVRLVKINKEDSEKYKKQVLSQREEYSSTTLPFKRGDIVDSKGTKIAYSEKVYNLVIDSYIIHNAGKDEKQKAAILNETMQALTQCFDIDEGKVRSDITENPSHRYYVVLKQLSYDEIAPFKEIQNDVKNNPNVKGVWFEEEYKRIYPYDKLACDAIGFTSADNLGTYGLEEFYNDTLNGIDGREYGYLNEESNLERTTKAAIDGNTLVSTIDVNIQKIIEKHILEFNESRKGKYRAGELGSYNTGVIVMNPKTGAVLGMASYPDFNLNDPRDITEYYSEAEIKKMEEEDTYFDTLNQLWRNFCVQDTFEPGSTAKAMTMAMGLDSGVLSGGEYYTCHGGLEVSGHYIGCNATGGHGELNFAQALGKSCNVAFMQMGTKIGKETFIKYLTDYNIGLKTNIDLSGEPKMDNTLVYKRPEDMTAASDLAISGFGQTYNVTMIQLAAAFCATINGGYYYQPHMVSEVKSASGVTIQKVEPRILKQPISNDTSAKMRQYLAAACIEGQGTGHKAVPAGYMIGGKTGTAEMAKRDKVNYVVSFIGFAPVTDPEVVVYVVVDRPNEEKQPDSSYAQEIARGIFTEILPYLQIFRTEELTEEEQEELEALKIIPSEKKDTEEDDGEEGESGEGGEDTGENGEDTGENSESEGGNNEEGTDAPPSSTPEGVPIIE